MAVSRETVLFYEPEGGAQGALLKSILVRMGVRIKNVSSEAVGQTIGCLLGRKGFDARENPEAPALDEPVLVMDGFTDKRLEILLREMKKNPRVIGVKNSSMPTQDIQMWHDEDLLVFNGPDEQFISGLAMGACAGIGGTYAVMPELFLKVYEHFQKGEMEAARQIQNEIDHIIYKMCSAHGNLYAVQKAILAKDGVPCGSVRKPMPALIDSDAAVVDEAHAMIAAAVAKFC